MASQTPFQQKVEEAKAAELLSVAVNPAIAAWIHQQKCNWTKLKVGERRLLQVSLSSFANFDPAAFKEEEWHRMYQLCLEYEKTNRFDISSREIYQNEKIGVWLVTQKSQVITQGKGVNAPEKIRLLKELRSIKEWLAEKELKSNKNTIDERMRKAADKPSLAEELLKEFQRQQESARRYEEAKQRAAQQEADQRQQEARQQEARRQQEMNRKKANGTHYQVLQVIPTACPEVISAAYKALALLHHPDKGGTSADFIRVKTAYEVLNDPVARANYDRTL